MHALDQVKVLQFTEVLVNKNRNIYIILLFFRNEYLARVSESFICLKMGVIVILVVVSYSIVH